MNDLSSILLSSKLLHCLSLEVVEEIIIPHGHVREFKKDVSIISIQDRVDDISILLSGKICMMHLFSNGNFSIFTTLTPSDGLGLELVGTPTRISPYLAMAAEPCEVFSFPADLIFQPGILSIEDCLALSRQLLSMVSNFNIQKEYRLAILSQNGLRDRIMTYLTMQADKRGTNSFKIPFSREEMASFLSVNRSALSHELSLMEKEGLITFSKNAFTLLSKPRDCLEIDISL